MDLDPRVKRLLDLLALLPGPQAPLWRYLGEEMGVTGDDWWKLAVADEFTKENLARIGCGEGQAAPLARACLYVFDGDNPDLWDQLIGQLDLGYSGIDALAGSRRWCADLCATAWEIHIHRQADSIRGGAFG